MNRDGILLLGGSGFIGSALTRRLASLGRQVHVISRAQSAPVEPGCTLHVGDMADPALLALLQPQCNTVVHLASTTTPGVSAGRPSLELDNLAPTLRLLDVLQHWENTHLVFISSGGTVYGNPARSPVPEDTPLAPLSPHGAGKAALEGFLHAFRSTGRAVTTLRLSNAYGPGQHQRQGFGLIRTTLQHMLQGTPLEIWGDGKCVRDFIYIDDAVDAIVAAVDRPSDSGIYNVGSGKGHTLMHVLETARHVCGAPLHINYRPARNVDVREIVLDISRVQAAFGWQPHIDLEVGIRRTWEWLKNHDAA